jgi:hypothetical protein
MASNGSMLAAADPSSFIVETLGRLAWPDAQCRKGSTRIERPVDTTTATVPLPAGWMRHAVWWSGCLLVSSAFAVVTCPPRLQCRT